MEIDTIIEKLDNITDRLLSFKDDTNNSFIQLKSDVDKRFDKIDGKVERIIKVINDQEKINLKQELLITSCQNNIDGLGKRLNEHIDYHNNNIIKETEDKTTLKNKVGMIWAVAVFIATQIGLSIFLIIKGFFK